MNARHVMSAILALCLAVAARDAWSGSVSGSFVLDGKALEVTEVSAFRIPERSNPKQLQTFVMLTREAPDRDAIMQSPDPYAVAINDPAASGDYLSLFIDSTGKVGLNAHVGGTQYIDSSGAIFGQQGALVASCAENTETRIRCAVGTSAPVKTAGDKVWSLQVSFDADVLRRAPGKPVAAGGGAPGEALMALRKALSGDDLDAILALLAGDVASRYESEWQSSEENLAEAKDTLSRQLPDKLTITGGEYRSDDEVLLDVEGYSAAFESTVIFSVTMLREAGRWGFAQSRLVGFPD